MSLRGAVGRRRALITWMTGLVLAASGCGSAGSATTAGNASLLVYGAGSTFAAPMYQQWASKYQQLVDHHVQVSYQAVGSLAGITAFRQGRVQFGATDAPLPAGAISAAGQQLRSPVLQLPMVLGAVAIVCNVPGTPRVVLSGRLLAAIYLGKIVRWNDAAIGRLNPGELLPRLPIEVFERSDASGTSQVFTRYLTDISPRWATEVGTGESPAWPIGTGVSGSSAIAADVKQARGAIGYVELGYAVTGQVPFASVINAAGRPVAPTPASISAAAAPLHFARTSAALAFSLVNSPAPAAYPLATPTYLLVAVRPRDQAKGRALRAWLLWALRRPEQSAVRQLSYAPLPAALAAGVRAAVRALS